MGGRTSARAADCACLGACIRPPDLVRTSRLHSFCVGRFSPAIQGAAKHASSIAHRCAASSTKAR
eukprot:6213797-Pleurochrysis_carterae.AAC.1